MTASLSWVSTTQQIHVNSPSISLTTYGTTIQLASGSAKLKVTRKNSRGYLKFTTEAMKLSTGSNLNQCRIVQIITTVSQWRIMRVNRVADTGATVVCCGPSVMGRQGVRKQILIPAKNNTQIISKKAAIVTRLCPSRHNIELRVINCVNLRALVYCQQFTRSIS